MLSRQVRWAEGATGAAIAKWIGWPGKVQGVMGGGTKACMAEIRWHRRVEAERIIDEIDYEGERIDWGLAKGWNRLD